MHAPTANEENWQKMKSACGNLAENEMSMRHRHRLLSVKEVPRSSNSMLATIHQRGNVNKTVTLSAMRTLKSSRFQTAFQMLRTCAQNTIHQLNFDAKLNANNIANGSIYNRSKYNTRITPDFIDQYCHSETHRSLSAFHFSPTFQILPLSRLDAASVTQS
jgi:hypothetical protein